MRSNPVGHIPQPIAAQIPMTIDLPAIAYERRQPSEVVSAFILSVPRQAALGTSGWLPISCHKEFLILVTFPEGKTQGVANVFPMRGLHFHRKQGSYR